MANRGAVSLTLLLVVVTLSGCTSESGGDEEGPPAPVVENHRLARLNIDVDPEGGQGEPSLGVAPDGTLFINGLSHEGYPDPGAVYRSKDGGATWEQVGRPTAPAPNFDPDLAVDLDGTVWFNTLYLGCVTVSSSRDGGESWSAPNPAACFGPGGDRQYIVPTRDGTAYLYYHQLPTFQQTAVKTTDYGQTWIPTGPVESPDHHLLLDEGSGWGGGGFWNPVTGSVFFTFSWFQDGPVGPGGWAPGYAVTRDDGATWSVGLGPAAEGDRLGLSLVVGAADEAGHVYLAWGEQFGSGEQAETHIYVARSTDDGMTWGPKVRVDTDERSVVFPTVTAGADGEVAVAYYAADERGRPGAVSDGARWNVTLAWTTDFNATNTTWERGELSNGTVKHGPICPNGSTCESDREFLDYFQTKRLPDGRIGAAYNFQPTPDEEVYTRYGATNETLLSPWGWT